MKRIETSAEMQWNIRLHTNILGYDVLHNDTAIVSQSILMKQDTRKFMTFGLAFSMAYSFYNKKDLEALLFYRLYTGLTNELKHTGCSMKLASGGLGVMVRFNRSSSHE